MLAQLWGLLQQAFAYKIGALKCMALFPKNCGRFSPKDMFMIDCIA